ncbi:MAG: signal transduction histidine kinase/DNA-binding response OmpR family regulator [Crocinitomix sp.]|jgi:signal transduction histidine kinase/DNA-binding response OmpR family regulator
MMLKNSCLTLILIVFTSFAQASKVDSVFKRAINLLDLSIDSAVQEVQDFNTRITSLSKKEQHAFHHQAANFYHSIGDIKSEIYFWDKELEFLPKNSDTSYSVLFQKSMAHVNIGELDEALNGLEKCWLFYKKDPVSEDLGGTYNLLAAVFGGKEDYELSIKCYLKGIEIFEELNNNQKLSAIHSNMSRTYNILGDIPKALSLDKKAYEYALEAKAEFNIHFCESSLGGLYLDLNKLDSAVWFLEKSKNYFEKNYNVRILTNIYADLGSCYSKMRQPEKSEVLFLKTIEILRKTENILDLSHALANYSCVLSGLKEYKKGIEVSREALQIPKETIGFLEVQLQATEGLYLNFKGDNQYDSALYYFESMQLLKDNANNTEIQKSLLKNELESDYNKEKNLLISDSNEEINDQISLKNYWILGFVILALIFLFVFFAYNQKKNLNKKIEREKEYLDNLLHNLVHEFRTPLTLIKGPTEELLKTDSENKLLRLVDKNSDQMLSLVNQVLDFAKIKAGRLEVNNEITNLNVFAEDTIALFQPIAKEKQVTLQSLLIGKGAIVMVDSDKLFKIVSNLLSNAIKYSNEGAQVTLKATVSEDWLELIVSDTGIGISAEDQEKVFNKFYQVDATITRKGEGTGLGLTFVKELVQLMEGEISLSSNVDQGTNVTVKLPIEIALIQTEESNKQTIENDSQQIVQIVGDELFENKRKLLIIEDNRDLQDFLSQILSERGYEIHNAMDGEQGVEMALEIVPDLVISDVMMPKMDGYQVVQQLKSNFVTEHIPIIILTAKASFDSMIEGLGAGADDYVSKPFKSQELVLRINNQIRRQEKLQEKYLQATHSEIPITKHVLIEKIEAITKVDLTTQLSVEVLAGKCALSRSQLHRKVKFITGLSTSALLTKMRLDLALIDLQKTDFSVSEIAYNYGYNDPAHFTKLFKKEFSKTPSEARE